MLIRPDNCTVDHYVFVIVISCQITKDSHDHTTFTSAAQMLMPVLSVIKTGRKIMSWDARAMVENETTPCDRIEQ